MSLRSTSTKNSGSGCSPCVAAMISSSQSEPRAHQHAIALRIPLARARTRMTSLRKAGCVDRAITRAIPVGQIDACGIIGRRRRHRICSIPSCDVPHLLLLSPTSGETVAYQTTDQEDAGEKHHSGHQYRGGEAGLSPIFKYVITSGNASSNATAESMADSTPKNRAGQISLNRIRKVEDLPDGVSHRPQLAERSFLPSAVVGRNFGDSHTKLPSVDGHLGLDLEAARDSGKALHEAPREYPVAGENVA